MNEKDRLAETIRDALELRDLEILTANFDDLIDGIDVKAYIADHLIAHNVTIPPVTVGQTVYIIRRPKGSLPWIAECTVGEIHVEYTADGKVCWFKSYNYEALEEDIGHWVFLAREEAEKMLEVSGDA